MKLLYKLLLGYLSIVFLIGGISTFVLLETIEKNADDLSVYRELEATSFVQVLNAIIIDKDGLKHSVYIQELFEDTLKRLPHIKRLTLHTFDDNSKRYVHIVSTDKKLIGQSSHAEDIEAIHNSKTTILYEDNINNERLIDITYPIVDTQNKTLGAMGATLSLSETDRVLEMHRDMLKNDALEDIVTAIALAVALAVFFTLIVLRKITMPLEELKRAVDSFSSENFVFIKVRSNDEIGDLSKAFNKMAHELSSLYQSMQEKIDAKTKKLENQFLTDTLTDMPNREALFKYMENSSEFNLAILDVASFKDINDSYGVEVGNRVIQILNKKVAQNLSDTKLLVYRLSGDEVVVLNPIAQSKKEFQSSIKSLIENIEEDTIHIKDKDKDINININISLHAGISFESEYALEKANLALISAKKERIDFVVFDANLDEKNKQMKNLKMISKIRDAVDNLSFVAYYQPIVDKDKKILKYETLVRMKDAKEILSPYFFLDIAKKTKYYPHITRAMVFQSFKEFEDAEQSFSINIEADDIINDDTRNFIIHNLENFKDPSRVVFEIVESEDVHKIRGIKEFISLIKEMGAKIAIDDFGTGYSNFGYLLDLKPDYIKIDGSLIKNIETDYQAYSIVKTVVSFAHNLNIKVIAEFVHSETVFEICRNLKIDEYQGYYFGEPSPKIK